MLNCTLIVGHNLIVGGAVHSNYSVIYFARIRRVIIER